MNIPITNRDFQLPEDGWFHIAPLGEFDHSTGVRQVLDGESLEKMVNRFRAESAAPAFAGTLVDFDHFSHNPEKASEAAGWITALENRESGLWAQIRWSDHGEAAVKGGRYRFVSPVWHRGDCEDLGENRLRPLRLDRLALTNDPNLKGLTPLSNRASASTDVTSNGSDSASTKTPPTSGKPNNQPTGDSMDYKEQLLAVLGLPPEATDDEIAAAIDGLKNCKDRMKNRAKDAEALVATMRAELTNRDLDTLNITDETERAQAAALLNAAPDRAVAVALLKNRATTAPARQPMTNRSTAKTPESNGSDVANKAEEAKAAKITNRAKQIQKEQGTSWPAAFAKAQAEFKD